MTPDSLHRLLADLPEPGGPHPIDAGLLGEYAFARRQHGQSIVGEHYPRVEAHLRTDCQRCQDQLEAIRTLVRRSELPDSPAREPASEAAINSDPPPIPEPLEIAEAIALAREIEAERDALRAPLRPDRSGQVDTRRQSARRRLLLRVEAALIRQRLVARRLFLDRAHASLSAPGSRPPNPKARLLLDDFAGGVDDLARLSSRVGRIVSDLRRLGDDPRGPARPQSEALANRGLSMTREALAVDQRLARLQGPLSGMVT
jgi:hypothetical protein